YGYIRNHKKTIKNGQARTRERKSEQKPEAKPRKVNLQSILDKSVISKLLVAHSHEEATSEQEKHKGEVGFTFGSLRKVTQDKMPQEGLAIIESKSKVRYSRSRAND
ncbi:hypothetical protein Tco_1359765, partial [Tanacetum coccineum]